MIQGGIDMKNKLLVLAWPVGFVFFLIYVIGNKYIYEYPDIIAYPLMIVAVFCMLVGCFYYGYCLHKGLDPYKFRNGKQK